MEKHHHQKFLVGNQLATLHKQLAQLPPMIKYLKRTNLLLSILILQAVAIGFWLISLNWTLEEEIKETRKEIQKLNHQIESIKPYLHNQ